MATETMMARQLTYFAARQKDGGHRCNIEAGMAKLLAARVAWANADAALQIHGGNGYAVEYPFSRLLGDARLLSIFADAAERQFAHRARPQMAEVGPSVRFGEHGGRQNCTPGAIAPSVRRFPRARRARLRSPSACPASRPKLAAAQCLRHHAHRGLAEAQSAVALAHHEPEHAHFR
jgi:hypothetical protein